MRTLILFLFIYSVAWSATTRDYQLDNGLRLLVRSDHRAPVVISQVWYGVGSSDEPVGLTGISHVLEHMMFKGTRDYPKGTLTKLVARHGGEENAATDSDYTFYYQELPAKQLALSFKLEADRMRHLVIDAKEFDNERQVVMEERRLRTDDNPQAVTFERFSAAAHIASPYAHPVVGWMDDLRHLKVEDVRAWYKRWYAPNNATVVVVGDVKPAQVLALAKKYFGGLPKQSIPQRKPARHLRALGERYVQVNIPAKLPWLLMGFNAPVIKTAKADWEPYALDVLAHILDGGASARLPKKLIRGDELASNVSVSYDPFNRYDTIFNVYGTPAQGHTLAQLKEALWREIRHVQEAAVTEQELARVKTQVVAAKTFARDSIAYQASQLGSLVSVGLSWKLADDYDKHIRAVTAAQVQAVAKKYLIPHRLTWAELIPAPLPAKKKEA